MSRALLPTELRRLLRLSAFRSPLSASDRPHGRIADRGWRRAFGPSPSPLPDSNRRPPPYHGGALPAELRGPFVVPRTTYLVQRRGEILPAADSQSSRESQYVIRNTQYGRTNGLALVPGEGFEPPKALPADLQSAPFGRSGIPASKPGTCRARRID